MSQKSHSLSPYLFRLSHQIFQVSPLKRHTALARFRWTQVVPSAPRLPGFVWVCFFLLPPAYSTTDLFQYLTLEHHEELVFRGMGLASWPVKVDCLN